MLFVLDGAGPPLGRALHGAKMTGTLALFTSSRGPSLGRALHRAGLPFVRRTARLALRRTLGSICAARQTFCALLGRGQAAASDQGRSCNRSQQAFSHLELSFIGGELPVHWWRIAGRRTPPPKDGSRLSEDKIDSLKYEHEKARPLLTISQQAKPVKFIYFEHRERNKIRKACVYPNACRYLLKPNTTQLRRSLLLVEAALFLIRSKPPDAAFRA